MTIVQNSKTMRDVILLLVINPQSDTSKETMHDTLVHDDDDDADDDDDDDDGGDGDDDDGDDDDDGAFCSKGRTRV